MVVMQGKCSDGFSTVVKRYETICRIWPCEMTWTSTNSTELL